MTGQPNCGTADDLGYCRERFHSAGCGSVAAPDAVDGLRPVMARLAAAPALDADGRVWENRQGGSPMTMTDHLESLSGVRVGDVSGLFESGHGRRELASPARRTHFSDYDDDTDPGYPVPSSTARTAARAAGQMGLHTAEDAARDRQAAARERDRRVAERALRTGGKVHMDYAAPPSREHRPVRLAQIGETWNGSLPQYGAGAV